MTKIIIAVVGPTAIGKTRCAISLAQHFDTEIISADSRQFYKEMKIGTAVPSNSELATVKHHFIQHISIKKPYSIGDFERDAALVLKELFQEKDIVILVGGSGMYLDAVCYGLDDFPQINPIVRKNLNTILDQNGLLPLQEQLKSLDAEYYHKVDLKNPHRLIRALEVCLSSGRPYSSFLGERKKHHDAKCLFIGLHASRQVIYNRINKRVDEMLQNGLLEEVKKLMPYRNLNALNTVGYKELFNYFDEQTTLPNAIAEIKKNTRRFAKRQLTWYRKNEAIQWVNHNLSEASFIGSVINQLEKIQDTTA